MFLHNINRLADFVAQVRGQRTIVSIGGPGDASAASKEDLEDSSNEIEEDIENDELVAVNEADPLSVALARAKEKKAMFLDAAPLDIGAKYQITTSAAVSDENEMDYVADGDEMDLAEAENDVPVKSFVFDAFK